MFDLKPLDPHVNGHRDVTASQMTLAIIWIISILSWILGSYRHRTTRVTNPDPEIGSETKGKDKNESESEASRNGDVVKETSEPLKTFSKAIVPPTHHEFFRYLSALGFVLLFFFLCDYLKVFPKDERIYTRDTFLFLVFLLFLAAIVGSVSDTSDKILNRDQTEEWKGWMQVLFVWYHYFAAVEWYNWIRVYIACYVWMTGFGNFSFFWIKQDYSLWRFMKMFFRLNFLVILVCATVGNEYMLYYICAMHTYWFLSVYFTMAIFPSWNAQTSMMTLKLFIYAACNYVIFDIPGVASVLFKPFWLILGLNDGHGDVMHEWVFRAGLDHWICFVGMLCAYNYPHFEQFIAYTEKQNEVRFLRIPSGNWIKAAVGGLILCVFYAWYEHILPLDKFSYNHLHPYTSFIPVMSYIYFRNVSRWLRGKYLGLFAYLGKITLETYLSQLHIYLQSNAKNLIGYFHGYPLLNFAFATLIYIPISHCLFEITIEVSAYLLPKDAKERSKKLIASVLVIAASTALGKTLELITGL